MAGYRWNQDKMSGVFQIYAKQIKEFEFAQSNSHKFMTETYNIFK